MSLSVDGTGSRKEPVNIIRGCEPLLVNFVAVPDELLFTAWQNALGCFLAGISVGRSSTVGSHVEKLHGIGQPPRL